MIFKNILDFIRKRAIELSGLLLIVAALVLSIAFFSYSPADPIHILGEDNIKINNLFGIYGVFVADFLLQSFGLASFLIPITLIIWGIVLMVKKEIPKIILKFFFLVLYLITS